MSNITDKTIETFLDELASKSATPGGGSAAALMGAQAAALVSMVGNLTIGKPKFAAIEREMQDVLQQSEMLRAQFINLIQADIDVFNRLMAKYALPKTTETDIQLRSEAIQEVLKEAIEVPMQCVHASIKVIELSKFAAENGNVNAVSDAGVAAISAHGALKSSALNVYINAGNLKDRDYAEAKISALEQMSQPIDAQVESIYQIVKSKL